MKKYFFIFATLLIAFVAESKIDPQQPMSSPNHQLSTPIKLFRDLFDFFGAEELGHHALKEENEAFIKNVMHNLDMDDYTIEIRGMSYAAQNKYGYINAFVLGAKFFAYLYVSEDWLDTLSLEEKQALIRHELMHIKKNHFVKKVGVFAISSAALNILAYILRNKVQAWANKPISTKEYVNLIDSKDRFILNITDPEKVKASPILQNIINFGISTVGATLLTTKYSRMCEKEADIEAAKTMLENKQGYINFLRNLQENTEENKTSKFEFKQAILDYLDPIIGLFRTHPTCDERIAYINEIE